jgi:hypothetical protein
LSVFKLRPAIWAKMAGNDQSMSEKEKNSQASHGRPIKGVKVVI